MKTIADWLWPTQARTRATKHNNRVHKGVATAEILVDEKSINLEGEALPPRYKVVCSECKDEN